MKKDFDQYQYPSINLKTIDYRIELKTILVNTNANEKLCQLKSSLELTQFLPGVQVEQNNNLAILLHIPECSTPVRTPPSPPLPNLAVSIFRFALIWLLAHGDVIWLGHTSSAAPPTHLLSRQKKLQYSSFFLIAVVQSCRCFRVERVRWLSRSGLNLGRSFSPGVFRKNKLRRVVACFEQLSKLLPPFSPSSRSSMAVKNGASDCWRSFKGYVCCARPRRGRTSDASWLAAQTLSGLTWQRLLLRSRACRRWWLAPQSPSHRCSWRRGALSQSVCQEQLC